MARRSGRIIIALVIASAFAFTPRAGAASAPIAPGWNAAADMPGPHDQAPAVTLPSGQVLVAGGLDGAGNPVAGAVLYDPTANAWSTAAAMRDARSGDTATLLPNGKVLVAGGQTGAGASLPGAELYDPASNTWSATGPLGAARRQHTATLLRNGKVLVTGGLNATGTLASAELYDPAAQSWSPAAAMGVPRYDHMAALLPDGRVLVFGGYTTIPTLASAEIYDPVTNTWSKIDDSGLSRATGDATVLKSGDILFSGGVNESGPGTITAAQAYDPYRDRWLPAGMLAYGRWGHTATALADGRVLVAGGNTDAPIAEIYDPSANTWSSAGAVPTPRNDAVTVALKDGRVLLAGGLTPGRGGMTSAELWTPESSLAVPAQADLGATSLGSTTTARTISVLNTGQDPLLLADIAVSGADAADFTLDPGTCGYPAVAPGASCQMQVRFTPGNVGNRSASLTFHANTSVGTHAVALTGQGAAPAGPAVATPSPVAPVVTGTVPRRIVVTLSYDFDAHIHATRVWALRVKDIPFGAGVKVTCPRGCSAKTWSKKRAAGSVALGRFTKRALKVHTVITVVVSHSGAIGAVKILTIRSNHSPRLATRCLPPGASAPRRCTASTDSFSA